MSLLHFNGIYIKARQTSSWVLDVRGFKKPFRHGAGFLIVKIDAALYCVVADDKSTETLVSPVSQLFNLLMCHKYVLLLSTTCSLVLL